MNALNNNSQTESSVTSVRGRALDLGSRKFWLEWRPLACCHARNFRICWLPTAAILWAKRNSAASWAPHTVVGGKSRWRWLTSSQNA